jgi:biotin-(acetyl-CoA carboxylase) ligase
MASDPRVRLRAAARPLDLPPPFRLRTLREAGDAFAHALGLASEEGAGTLVWVGRFDLVEFALVLEPEQPLCTARRTFYAGMAALADALVAHAPPQKIVNIAWPDALFVDGGCVGGARLGWPANAQEERVPSWLVFGAMVRTALMGGEEPGMHPGATALEAEGFEELGLGRLVESFARHFMVILDAWQEQGFGAVEKAYLSHLPMEPGVRREIDENGDLLVRRMNAIERRALVSALAAVSWFDPETGAPRL